MATVPERGRDGCLSFSVFSVPLWQAVLGRCGEQFLGCSQKEDPKVKYTLADFARPYSRFAIGAATPRRILAGTS